VIGTTVVNRTYPVTGRNSDASWFEICCYGEKPAWVAASVVATSGNMDSVALARNIPPSPTAAPATPIPSPVPQRVITPPPDWVEYRQPDGLFAFSHPPTWQEGVPFSGGTQFAILEPYLYFSVDVYPEAYWRGKSDAQIRKAMVELAQSVAEIGGSKFKLISQSRLPTSTRTNSIHYTSARGLVELNYMVLVVILPGESAAVSVRGSSTGKAIAPLTDAEAQMIAGSFRKP
jgi:hypothetical protein